MITSENPSVRVGLIGAKAWSEAVAKVHGSLPSDAEEMMALEWEAAGIVDPDRQPDTDWMRALEVTRKAAIGAEVVSVYEAMVFSGTLLVDGDDVVCVTARAAFEEEGERQVTAVHPMLEVAIAPRKLVWLLLRRVLPPLDELRAEPRETQPGDIEPLTLDGVEIPESIQADPEKFSAHLVHLPGLPAALYDALEPTAEVYAYVLASKDGDVRHTSQAWALGDRGLYRIDSDTAQVAKVPAGDLAHRLVAEL